jgi:hypothetical protein
MGGSLPGAVGFTYARTGSIPSNGKYAKKTKASAQDGSTIEYDSPEYAKAWKEGKIQNKTADGNIEPYWGGELDEVTINVPKKEKNWLEQYRDKIVEENKDAGLLEAIIGTPISAITSLPQLMGMKALTGEMQRPSEGMNIENPYGAMLADAILDPANLIGAGILTKENALSKLGKIPANIVPELRQSLKGAGPSFGKRVGEHVIGLGQGIEDIVKGRPIFETFPITSAQKQASNIAQDKALQEGVDFAENWFYKNKQIRPNVRNKIDDISVAEPNAQMNDYTYNPFSSTQNKLVSSRSGDLPFENVSDEAKEYIQNSRGRIGGVNMGNTYESITLRNMGMYKLSPQQIKNTVVHEAAHTAQDIGDHVPWGTMTTEFSPNLKYFTSNPNTNIGQRFKNALRTPRKPSGDSYSHRTWQSSPNELHSELMSARSQLYDKFLKEGKSAEEAMDLLQNPGDETLNALHKIGGLDQFFKQNRWGKSKVPMQTKRDLMRILPAAIPVAVGAGALQQQKEGGIIKDDMGQYNHPGEITEINSPYITMQGVPYPVLGISDTGDTQMMYPEEEYEFDGSKVTEFPMAKNGRRQEQKGLQNLDNLVNFTNYNKPTIGGWLNKYN